MSSRVSYCVMHDVFMLCTCLMVLRRFWCSSAAPPTASCLFTMADVLVPAQEPLQKRRRLRAKGQGDAFGAGTAALPAEPQQRVRNAREPRGRQARGAPDASRAFYKTFFASFQDWSARRVSCGTWSPGWPKPGLFCLRSAAAEQRAAVLAAWAAESASRADVKV